MENFKKPCFFSVDSFNIFSFHNKDHATRNGKQTLPWIFEMLEGSGVKKQEIANVELLTHPRCFGFVFNPVSFYFCFDEKEEIVAVVAEVNNTFGQTHSYVVKNEDGLPINEMKFYKMKKELFVSPFFSVEGHYEFRFVHKKDPKKQKIAVFINYFKEGNLAFETSLTGKLVKFSARNAMPYVFTTFKTVFLTVVQAFRLKFLKKLKFNKPKK